MHRYVCVGARGLVTFAYARIFIHVILMNMKENILFLVFVFRGNFDHVGGTPSKHKENTRNERKRLRQTFKLVERSVFLETLNVILILILYILKT